MLIEVVGNDTKPLWIESTKIVGVSAKPPAMCIVNVACGEKTEEWHLCDDADRVRRAVDEANGVQMDPVLAEAVARRIAAWMDTAAQESRNTNFYRTLLRQCGDIIGPESRVSDDGSIQDDVIALKVPSLIERLKENLRIARARLDRYEESVE